MIFKWSSSVVEDYLAGMSNDPQIFERVSVGWQHLNSNVPFCGENEEFVVQLRYHLKIYPAFWFLCNSRCLTLM